MHDSIKMILVLTLVAILSGGVLAQTYRFAEPRIEAVRQERLATAVFNVIPDAQEFERMDTLDMEIFKGLSETGDIVGYAFTAKETGFNDIIRIMVGVDARGEVITGIEVLEHTETPGLGARITETEYLAQFIGKTVDTSFASKDSIDAITGATITSEAMAKGLQGGLHQSLSIIEGREEQ